MEEIIRECLPTYRIVEKLGQGVYGSVYRIRDPFKERAAKVVPLTTERSLSNRTPEALDSRISRDFHSVREYYETIRGTGVIDIYDFHMVGKRVSKQGAKAYLVILMELYPENLQDHVLDNYPLAARNTLRLMRELSEILSRLFRRGNSAFLVTDLKPSNLLLNKEQHLLIGDLGGLKRISSVSTISGSQFSPNWCAPEIMLKGESPDISTAVYAYGLVSYFAWEGHLPYEDQDFSQRPQMIRENGVSFNRKDLPDPIGQLIRRCLSFDTQGRPGDFDEIQNIIEEEKNRGSNDSTVSPLKISSNPPPISAGGSKTLQRGSVIPDPGGSGSAESWVDPVSGMVFVRVPGGKFMMGALEGDRQAESTEKPARPVAVDPFWIGKFPVTQQQWEAVMDHNPSHFKKGGRYPVEQVSWNDAVTFAQKLSNRHNGKYRFGLPKEAQWEFAARSCGKAELFAGGNDPSPLAWYRDNSEFMSHPVGGKNPNDLQIYDMSGNVMEWCADLFIPTAYRRNPSRESESNDSRSARVCRGGSWTHDAKRCRTTDRRGVPAGLRYTSLGFRLLRFD